jgi:hypothetical protein
MMISAFLYVLFEERFTIGVATGGRGALQPLDLLVPMVGALVFLGVGRIPAAQFFRLRPVALFWAPYIALTIALPVMGVFIRSEPVRTMYTAIHGFIDLSFFIFGAWAAFGGAPIRKLAERYAWTAIVVEFLFALIDYLNKTGMYPTAIGAFLLKWNVESEGALGEFTFITWRCVGTFINPNDLGFWSVVAFWMSALLFRGIFRSTGVLIALFTLILSQSRGSLLSLLGTSCVWLAYLALSRDAQLKKARDTTYVAAICVVLTIGWLGAVVSQSDEVMISDKFSFIQRFGRGLDVLTEGAGADENAEARVNAWRRAVDFYYEHPFGTWSSPRMKFHLYIDSDYVRALLQGSILYLFAMLMVIGGAFRRIVCPGFASRAGAMIAITTAINGISAYPLFYPAIGIFWIVLGYDLTAERIHKQALRKQLRVYSLAPELATVD